MVRTDMKKFKIITLAGDGIGPEITSSAVKILNAISDLNDIELLNQVGLSSMPINSPILDSFSLDYITKRDGGQGAFREFADQIIKARLSN